MKIKYYVKENKIGEFDIYQVTYLPEIVYFRFHIGGFEKIEYAKSYASEKTQEKMRWR